VRGPLVSVSQTSVQRATGVARAEGRPTTSVPVTGARLCPASVSWLRSAAVQHEADRTRQGGGRAGLTESTSCTTELLTMLSHKSFMVLVSQLL